MRPSSSKAASAAAISAARLVEAALHRVEAGERLQHVRRRHEVSGHLFADRLASLDRLGAPARGRRRATTRSIRAARSLVLEPAAAGVLGRLLPRLGRGLRARRAASSASRAAGARCRGPARRRPPRTPGHPLHHRGRIRATAGSLRLMPSICLLDQRVRQARSSPAASAARRPPPRARAPRREPARLDQGAAEVGEQRRRRGLVPGSSAAARSSSVPPRRDRCGAAPAARGLEPVGRAPQAPLSAAVAPSSDWKRQACSRW